MEKKDLDAANEAISTLEVKLASATSNLDETRAKIVVLNNGNEKGIDAYMLIPKFKELMEEHDALVHPVRRLRPSLRLTLKWLLQILSLALQRFLDWGELQKS